MVYEAWEYSNFDQIPTFFLGETIDKHIHEYFRARNAADTLGKILLYNDEYAAPIAVFVYKILKTHSPTNIVSRYSDSRLCKPVPINTQSQQQSPTCA